MTRAERELYLTSARDYGGTRERKVSQFVLEALDLPKDAARPFKARAIEEIQRFAPPAEATDEMLAPIPPEQELVISHKQVDDYQTCPLKYRYVNVLRVPILRHHAVVYGATIHRSSSTTCCAARPATTRRSRTCSRSTNASGHQGFLTWEHEEARKAAGRQALTRFWHEEEAAAEADVRREGVRLLAGTRPRARPLRPLDEDLLGATIIDYKTGEVAKQKVADRRAAESLQLKLYALAWREMTGALPQRVELRFLESNLVGRHTPARRHGGGDRRGARRGSRHPRARVRGDAVLQRLPALRVQPDLSLHRDAGVAARQRTSLRVDEDLRSAHWTRLC